MTARLPWDHIDIGLEPDFLVKEYRKALKDRLSPPCGKPFKKLLHPSNVADAEAAAAEKLVCYDCGVACDLGAMKEERLFFLRRMNAWPPPARSRPCAAAEGRTPREHAGDRAAEARVAGDAPPLPAPLHEARAGGLPRPPGSGAPPAAHLPARRARALLLGGFHPKPELSFGPALGLGIPSLGELLDVTLVDDVDAGRAAAAAGARHARRHRVPRGGRARATTIGRSGGVIARGGVRGAAARRTSTSAPAFARAAAASRCPCCATSEKEIGRMIDVRKTLLSAARWDDGERAPHCSTGTAGRR